MKNLKAFKILLSATSLGAIVASGTSIVSCGSHAKTWANYINDAKNASPKNILNNSIVSWKGTASKELHNGDFKIDKKDHTINVLLTNDAKQESASFSAKYSGQRYSNSDWVYNGDQRYLFTANSAIDKNTHISYTGLVNNQLYVGYWTVDQKTKMEEYGYLVSDDQGKTFSSSHKLNTVANVKGSERSITNIVTLNNVIYIETQYDGLFQSIDQGKTFTHNSEFVDSADNILNINSIIEFNNLTYVATNGGLYQRSSNDNNSKFIISPTFDKEDIIISSMLVTSQGVLYVATYNNFYYYDNKAQAFKLDDAMVIAPSSGHGPTQIIEHDKKLYVSIHRAIYILSIDPNDHKTKVNNIYKAEEYINSINIFDNKLFVAGDSLKVFDLSNSNKAIAFNTPFSSEGINHINVIDGTIYLVLNLTICSWNPSHKLIDNKLNFVANDIAKFHNKISQINKVNDNIFLATDIGLYQHIG